MSTGHKLTNTTFKNEATNFALVFDKLLGRRSLPNADLPRDLGMTIRARPSHAAGMAPAAMAANTSSHAHCYLTPRLVWHHGAALPERVARSSKTSRGSISDTSVSTRTATQDLLTDTGNTRGSRPSRTTASKRA